MTRPLHIYAFGGTVDGQYDCVSIPNTAQGLQKLLSTSLQMRGGVFILLNLIARDLIPNYAEHALTTLFEDVNEAEALIEDGVPCWGTFQVEDGLWIYGFGATKAEAMAEYLIGLLDNEGNTVIWRGEK